MESSMMRMIKLQNPGKEYPSNLGQKWTNEEENIMLEELNKNLDIDTIAQNHGRTVGGIKARVKLFAYEMYLKNISIEEIAEKTKLNETSIKEIIDFKKNYNKNKQTEKVKNYKKTTDNILISIKQNDYNELKTELKEVNTELTDIKNEIKNMKNSINELIDMMKAVYEFEDA
jgi:predicted RND superfamily exporter protein